MRAAAPAACLLLIMLGAAVYWPGLDGPFVFDDLPNITRHTAVAVDELTLDTLHEAATSTGSGASASQNAAESPSATCPLSQTTESRTRSASLRSRASFSATRIL